MGPVTAASVCCTNVKWNENTLASLWSRISLYTRNCACRSSAWSLRVAIAPISASAPDEPNDKQINATLCGTRSGLQLWCLSPRDRAADGSAQLSTHVPSGCRNLRMRDCSNGICRILLTDGRSRALRWSIIPTRLRRSALHSFSLVARAAQLSSRTAQPSGEHSHTL